MAAIISIGAPVVIAPNLKFNHLKFKKWLLNDSTSSFTTEKSPTKIPSKWKVDDDEENRNHPWSDSDEDEHGRIDEVEMIKEEVSPGGMSMVAFLQSILGAMREIMTSFVGRIYGVCDFSNLI